MTDLFNRDFILNVGGLEIRSRSKEGQTRPTLKVTFRIELSLEKDPNTAEISIYNLNKDSRSFLQQAETLPTSVQAGYIDNTSQIFAGDLEYGRTVRMGVDWVTSVQSRDGGVSVQTRISESFKKIQIGEVLKQLVTKMGVQLGNAAEKALAGPQRGDATEFIKGIVTQGLAIDEIDRIARQMGLRFSIQAGEARFLTPQETLSGKAIVLSEETGLIGSPEPGENGAVNAKTLLQPQLLPGLRVQITSAEINGFFRVERAIFTGDSWGTDWYTDVEVKPLT